MLFAATTFALIASAKATTFTVNSPADLPDANTADNVCEATASARDCTLRAAIQQAAAGDVITFSLPTGSTISLTIGELLIDKNLTITGPGAANLAVERSSSASAFFRIFDVNPGLTVSISRLSVNNGNVSGKGNPSGGGILNNSSTLTVTGCAFGGNTAAYGGALCNFGENGTVATLVVDACTFTSNTTTNIGGAIYNDAELGTATLTVSGSTFTSNTSKSGGAIYNDGESGVGTGATAQITGSTFDSNSSADGGVLYNDSEQRTSGAAPGRATCTFRDSTLSNNFVSSRFPFAGSIDNDAEGGTGLVEIIHSTISGSSGARYGGAIYNDGYNAGAVPGAGGATLNISSGSVITGNSTTANANGYAGGIYSDGSGPQGKAVVNMTDSSLTRNTATFGGGIYNEVGTVMITRCDVSNNSANDNNNGQGGGAIYNSASRSGQSQVTIASSTFAQNAVVTPAGATTFGQGGAIYSNTDSGATTSLSITGSSFSGNSAPAAGAIYLYTYTGSNVPAASTQCAVDHTTLNGNAANVSDGGAIQHFAQDGGASTLTVVDATFSGNMAVRNGGAIDSAAVQSQSSGGNAALTIGNSTFADNTAQSGASVFSERQGTLGAASETFAHTILKTGSSGGNLAGSGGTLTSNGYNLSNDATGPNNGTTDRINTDPLLLGTLQDNGGMVLTHALLAGSPALDAGDPNFDATALPTDERGFPRVRHGRIDIGAYEAPPAPVITGPENGAHTNGAPLITGTAEPRSTVVLTITGSSGSVIVTTTADLDGKFSVSASGLTDGSYSVTGAEGYSSGEIAQAPFPSNRRSFTVDTTPPVISGVPANVTAEATGPSGATVTYAQPTANDNIDGPVPVTCAPASGSTFALGTTMVTCSASDQVGNTSHANFNVTVRDTTPPVFSNVPSNITAEATSRNGAVVNYNPPTANDTVSGSVAVTCGPASGSTFALGTTTVSCTATDNAGNTGTATFKVTVADTMPPTISNAPDLTVQTTDPSGTTVSYSPSADDTVSGSVPVTCSPTWGSKFTLGVSTVTCTAKDGAGNTATKSFSVTVNKAPNLTSASSATYKIGTSSSFAITTDSSYPAKITLSENGALPSGITFTDNGNGTATLAGTAAAGTVGTYSLTLAASNGISPEASQTFTLTVVAPAQPGNLSSRNDVGTGDNVMIGGFIITGTVPKKVLVVGLGPSTGVDGALKDPVLELHGASGFQTVINDNWQETQKSEIEATGMAPKDPLEAAIVATLEPGAYTGIVSGKGSTTGIALVAVYDLNSDANAQLANISTRGIVGTGDSVLIGGFILGGAPGDSVSVVVRGIGPTLKDFGVANSLPDPTLEIKDSNGTSVATNDDWQSDSAQASKISSYNLQPKSSAESAIYASLPPGAYSAIVAGKGVTGVGLVEIYHVQ